MTTTKKKELTPEELSKLLATYRSALTVLKMSSKMGQLKETHKIKQLKKDIARMLTIKNKLSKPVSKTQ
jgi:large subunit ribosomal protein L29